MIFIVFLRLLFPVRDLRRLCEHSQSQFSSQINALYESSKLVKLFTGCVRLCKADAKAQCSNIKHVLQNGKTLSEVFQNFLTD